MDVLDPDCFGRDNWKFLVEKYEKLLNTQYESCHGDVYTFFGLVHASDDYYFGMTENSTKKLILLSCVGDIEDFGFKVYDIEDFGFKVYAGEK